VVGRPTHYPGRERECPLRVILDTHEHGPARIDGPVITGSVYRA